MTSIGVGPCPGFHWVWKGLPSIGIPGKGTGPIHGFQDRCEEGIPKCAPCVGIVPCTHVVVHNRGCTRPKRKLKRKCCYQMHRTKRKVSNQPTYYKEGVLDYLLQTSLCFARSSVEEHRRARGTKGVYDPRRKGKR
jgi:hypothetical protein